MTGITATRTSSVGCNYRNPSLPTTALFWWTTRTGLNHGRQPWTLSIRALMDTGFPSMRAPPGTVIQRFGMVLWFCKGPGGPEGRYVAVEGGRKRGPRATGWTGRSGMLSGTGRVRLILRDGTRD